MNFPFVFIPFNISLHFILFLKAIALHRGLDKILLSGSAPLSHIAIEKNATSLQAEDGFATDIMGIWIINGEILGSELWQSSKQVAVRGFSCSVVHCLPTFSLPQFSISGCLTGQKYYMMAKCWLK